MPAETTCCYLQSLSSLFTCTTGDNYLLTSNKLCLQVWSSWKHVSKRKWSNDTEDYRKWKCCSSWSTDFDNKLNSNHIIDTKKGVLIWFFFSFWISSSLQNFVTEGDNTKAHLLQSNTDTQQGHLLFEHNFITKTYMQNSDTFFMRKWKINKGQHEYWVKYILTVG